jgi:hypothetical protein
LISFAEPAFLGGEARPTGVASANAARRPSGRSRIGRGHTIETGDLQGLVDVLAPDVVLLSDGGGVKQALLRPITGANRVARVLGLGLPRIVGEVSVEPVQVNGGPALIIRIDGEIDNVVAVRIDNGLITGLYAVRNPEKLSRMERETAVSR